MHRCLERLGQCTRCGFVHVLTDGCFGDCSRGALNAVLNASGSTPDVVLERSDAAVVVFDASDVALIAVLEGVPTHPKILQKAQTPTLRFENI